MKVPTWYGWINLFPAEPTVRAITSTIIQSRTISLETVPVLATTQHRNNQSIVLQLPGIKPGSPAS